MVVAGAVKVFPRHRLCSFILRSWHKRAWDGTRPFTPRRFFMQGCGSKDKGIKMTTPKCFCIQEPSLERDRITGRLIPKDLSSAVRYGRVEFILDQEDKPSLTPGPCMRKITNALQEFRPDDYLFHAGGDQLALLLVGAALRKAGFNEVNYLRWEREIDAETGRRTGGGYYVPVTVRLNF